MAQEQTENIAILNGDMEDSDYEPKTGRIGVSEEESAQRISDIDYSTVETTTVEDRMEVLAKQTGMEVIQLRKSRLLPEVVNLLPKKTAVRYNVIVTDSQDGKVTVAVGDPHNVEAIDTVSLLLPGKQLRWVLARPEEIKWSIERYYTGETAIVEDMLTEISESASEGPATYEQALKEVKADEEGPIKRLVDLIFTEALRMRSSDIHFEPFENKFRIRFRIDGVLHEIQSPDKTLQGPILSRLKLMAGMDLAEKRVPQDGRIQQVVLGRELDFRVSALPALHGESVVLRILEKSGVLLGLEQIGFLEDNIEKFKSMIRRPNGIILMTGPTGSGKTTTLYSALNVINNVDTKIVTVENPVEYQIEGINQVQVNDEIGLTFAKALRSILRQAPNVILVGEIRDLETAEIAISAAMTGHLVFSTLHTNDAPGANTRLVEMGIKPFLVASAIQAVIAQRLVRTICKECKETYEADPTVIRNLGFDPDEYKGVPFYRGRGCEICNYTGYKGRTAIHEVMENSDEIRKLVMENSGSDVIRKVARQQGMRTLREDGWKKVLRGDTTMVEVARITAGDEI